MLSSTPYAQHKHNEQEIAAERLLDMESLQQKVMEQQATIERLIAIVISCSDLAGVNLDNFCNAEKIENIPEAINKKIVKLMDKNRRAQTDLKRMENKVSILEARLELIGDSNPSAWGLIHQTQQGIELGKCIYKTKDEALKESSLLSTRGHVVALFKHPVNRNASFPNGFLMSAIQRVECDHFRSDCDTGASHHAMVVLNAFRSLAGLQPISKIDLPVWCDTHYVFPEFSKLLGAQESLPVLSRIGISDLRNIALSFSRHLFELNEQEIENLEVGFDLWMTGSGMELMDRMNSLSVAVVNSCLGACTVDHQLLGIPFSAGTGFPKVTNHMKSQHHGEYSFRVVTGSDEDGKESSMEVVVPWDMVKKIYKEMALSAAQEINL